LTKLLIVVEFISCYQSYLSLTETIRWNGKTAPMADTISTGSVNIYRNTNQM